MSQLSKLDYFVYGALVARTKNNAEPIVLSKKELFSITGASQLQIALSIKKLHSAQLLVVIWFCEDAHIRINQVFPELLSSTIQQEQVA